MNTQPSTTPETDHLERNLGNAAHPVLLSFCRKLERERDILRRWTTVNGVIDLERELDEARAQRDEARETIAATLRAWQTAQEIIIAVTKELDEARGQRDRLAEVIEAASVLIAAKGRHNTMLAYNGLRDALQSLTTNATAQTPPPQDSDSK